MDGKGLVRLGNLGMPDKDVRFSRKPKNVTPFALKNKYRTLVEWKAPGKL